MSEQHPAEIDTNPRSTFYEALVDPSQIAISGYVSAGVRRVPIDIIRKDAISVDGTAIPLKGHGLFAMNALLVSGEPASVDTLMSHGFDEKASAADLTKAIGRLGTRLQRASGSELVIAVGDGKKKRFALSPAITVEDKRTPDAKEEVEKAARKRQRIISDLVQRYDEEPSVLQHVERLRVRPTDARVNTSNYDEYLRYAGQFDLLTAEQEQELFATLEQGIAAYEALQNPQEPGNAEAALFIEAVKAQRTLLLSNLRLVSSVSKRYFNITPLPAMDLVQEGVIGLNRAIAGFDHKKGFKLSTFATWWIRQAVTRSIADTGRTIRLPAGMHDAWLRVQRVKRDLSAKLERDPTKEELADAAGLSTTNIDLCEKFGQFNLPSLDAPVEGDHDDPNLTLGHKVASTMVDPRDPYEHIAIQAEVDKLFASPELNDNEKLILGLRFGTLDSIPRTLEPTAKGKKPLPYLRFIDALPTTNGLTLTEISKLFGVSRERVRQIEATAMRAALRVLEQES